METQEMNKLKKETIRSLFESAIERTIINRCILIGFIVGFIVSICQHNYWIVFIGIGIGAVASWILMDWKIFRAEEININKKKKAAEEKVVLIQKKITVLKTNMPQDTMNLTEEHAMAVKKLRLQEKKLAQTQIMIDLYNLAL